ncbi:MAG: GNAT family N-acetyltransferase [Solirubrobacterales bacterium]
MTEPIEIRKTAPDDPEAVALVDAMSEEAARVYADRPLPRAQPLSELLGPSGTVLVVTVGGETIGCGSVRVIEPGVAEIKRMFVSPAWRGRGIGRQLLSALEREATELGCPFARLDTGDRQHAALALYRSAGYEPIDDYNGNRGATHWFEKRIG